MSSYNDRPILGGWFSSRFWYFEILAILVIVYLPATRAFDLNAWLTWTPFAIWIAGGIVGLAWTSSKAP